MTIFKKNKQEIVCIAALYFFLFAGGLWHVLNVFQATMRLLAAPLIFVLACWIFRDIYKKYPSKILKRKQYFFWSLGVIFLSFLIELLGVKTGKIFGHYFYGETLQPKIYGVPIAIGFAWLVMLLSSISIVNKIKICSGKEYIFVCSAIIALFMVIFDSVMEPAAVKLSYWHWVSNNIPIQNYVAWFLISYLFSLVVLKLKIFHQINSNIAVHAYFAQLIYFGLIILK